jgi:hypothetical protein
VQEREKEAGSEASVASEVTERVHAIITAAENVANAIRHDVAQEAEVRRREAEAEAQRYLEEARRKADVLAADRARRMAELSDTIIERTEALLGRLDGAEDVKRQLESLVRALGEAAEGLAPEVERLGEPGDEGGQPFPRWRERVEETAQAATESLDRGPVVPPPDAHGVEGGAGEFDDARLVAFQMAVAGGTRAEVAEHLSQAYDVVRPDTILDDVFGKGTPGDHRVDVAEPGADARD